MRRTVVPETQARPPDRTLGEDTDGSGTVWGLLGLMWVLALIAIVIHHFTPADLGALAFVSWVVFLAVIALALIAGFRGS